VLRLKNVDVHYGRIHAVRRASLSVREGEIVALIGGNGAGKTTLLTTISGLRRPSDGSIAYAGREIARDAPDKIVRAGLSHVPEGRLMFKPMSVEDNLRLGAFARKRAERAAVRRDMEDVYALFPALAGRRRQAAGTLSGGEQQMLAIGRALIAKPDLLLLDEPSLGLAPLVVELIADTLLAINRTGVSILLVEQNAKLALDIAHYGYVMDKGEVVRHGPAGDLRDDPSIADIYLGFEGAAGGAEGREA